MAPNRDLTATDGVPTPEDVPRMDDMPMLGFGTWEIEDPEICETAVETALDIGYRHIDTAQAYGNEAAVGDGIENARIDRDEIFLATKLWIDELDREGTVDSAYRSLNRLGTEYIDLLYVHWPARDYDPETTMAALDDLVEEGVVRHIGVSNFEPDQLEEAVRQSNHPIFANQFESHPLLPQRRLVDACREHDVHPVAYSPLARGRITEVPAVADVAAKHEVTPAQVSLAWLRQRGLTALPKAASDEHRRDNWRSLALQLDAADMEKLNDIDRRERQVSPSWAPWREQN